ncbi:hypothetical protein K2173_026131 [Erythroxylum novogranatense]|uniref:Integrase catalytic domain-containing protein n=1 Tax=Erythroxylum novogranatense TaxID=1862640 RepID=A0AAV8TZY4_9ROSI|nr:hypothetical protein K2173_026131 [Erythroxylum novogranatense]
MEADIQPSFSQVAPTLFDGQNYQAWATRMTAVEEDYDVPPLPTNPTVAQMKNHKERKIRKSKAKACLFSAVSSTIFTRIMNLESTKEIWDYLKKEYQGSERTKNMQILNLIREFEMVKMKESESIKDYSDKLLGIINKVRLLGKDFSDERISKISSLEESKDLSSISLAELVNALGRTTFVATCFATNNSSSDSWLIDSGCTNHMTNDQTLFIEIDKTLISKVKLEMVSLSRLTGLKHITDVLYVPDIDQNLLSVPLLEEQLTDCVACQYGKQSRKPFPQSAWRATNKLQLVHTDVANVFWKFKTWVENQSDCRLHTIRSDNGKEFVNETFDKFCEEAGIEHQLTAPYTPQQNGVSERKNRSIMEMARCMLHEKELPKNLWAEAASTAIFLLNRLPTRAVHGKTPFEAWFGYKPCLQNMKIFCCLSFSYVPQKKRDKLDKKAEPGVFVGYSSTSKAYKIFQPQNGKIIVSRDVKFMENKQWSWEESIEKLLPENSQYLDDDFDVVPVRGIRPLSGIYERSNVVVFEPAKFKEAEKDDKWIESMREELQMIEKNGTWELVDRPQDRKIIGVKWVYRTKINADGSINKHKARLVVKGYSQVFGVDFS